MQANVKAKAEADAESNALLDMLDEVSGFTVFAQLLGVNNGHLVTPSMERCTYRRYPIMDITNCRVYQ